MGPAVQGLEAKVAKDRQVSVFRLADSFGQSLGNTDLLDARGGEPRLAKPAHICSERSPDHCEVLECREYVDVDRGCGQVLGGQFPGVQPMYGRVNFSEQLVEGMHDDSMKDASVGKDTCEFANRGRKILQVHQDVIGYDAVESAGGEPRGARKVGDNEAHSRITAALSGDFH